MSKKQDVKLFYILTDFQNSFTSTLEQKICNKMFIEDPMHFKQVATSAYEILMAVNHRALYAGAAVLLKDEVDRNKSQ